MGARGIWIHASPAVIEAQLPGVRFQIQPRVMRDKEAFPRRLQFSPLAFPRSPFLENDWPFHRNPAFFGKERDNRIRLRAVKLLPLTSLTPRSHPNPGSTVRHLIHPLARVAFPLDGTTRNLFVGEYIEPSWTVQTACSVDSPLQIISRIQHLLRLSYLSYGARKAHLTGTMSRTQIVRVPHLGGIDASYHMPYPYDAKKPTLVLVNSFTTSADLYRKQYDDKALTDSMNLLAIELLGHGQTRTNRENWTYWDTAEMNLQVLDALGIEKAFVLGTSQGGWITVRMALMRPEKVSESRISTRA